MASQHTIQLREVEDTSDHLPGQFSVPLKKDLFLEQGDSVVIRQAFCDTVQDGKINIANDYKFDTTPVPLTIKFGRILTNTLDDSFVKLCGFGDNELTPTALTTAAATTGNNHMIVTGQTIPVNQTGMIESGTKSHLVKSISCVSGGKTDFLVENNIPANEIGSGVTIQYYNTVSTASPDHDNYVLMNLNTGHTTSMTVDSVNGKDITFANDVPTNVKAGMFIKDMTSTKMKPAVNEIENINGKVITVKSTMTTAPSNGDKITALYLGNEVKHFESFVLRVPGHFWSETDTTYIQCTDVSGNIQFKQCHVENGEWFTMEIKFNVGAYVLADSQKFNLTSDLHIHQINISDVADADTETHFAEPQMTTLTINIPVGNYTPGEITKKMNDQSQSIGALGEVDVANQNYENKDNTAGTELLMSSAETTNRSALDVNTLMFVREDGDSIALLNQNQFWVGAPSLAIDYDPDLNTFFFENMHLPLHASSGGSQSSGQETSIIGVPGNVDTGTVQMKHVGRGGGIFTSDLQPASIWGNQLGFSNNYKPLFTRGVSTRHFRHDQSTIKINPLVCDNLNDHTTSMFLNASSFMNQNPGAGAGNNEVKGGTTPAEKLKSGPVEIDGNEFTKVFADRNVDRTSMQTTPYLQIELTGIPNVQHNSLSTKPIAQVVGKCYTTGRHTASAEEGVLYTHQGAPMQVGKLGCRTLNPNGSLADTGGDSCVFLDVVKAQAQPPRK